MARWRNREALLDLFFSSSHLAQIGFFQLPFACRRSGQSVEDQDSQEIAKILAPDCVFSNIFCANQKLLNNISDVVGDMVFENSSNLVENGTIRRRISRII